MAAADDRARALLELHADIDREARSVASAHGERLRCAHGCSQCCADDLSVLEVEAERIRREFSELLRTEQPAPRGGCAFLDAAGGCRVYSARPQVCRTQGLPLRWFEEDAAERIVEQRDICPLNADGPPLAALPEAALWLIGPSELRLLELSGAEATPARIALRDLFDPDRARDPSDKHQ